MGQVESLRDKNVNYEAKVPNITTLHVPSDTCLLGPHLTCLPMCVCACVYTCRGACVRACMSVCVCACEICDQWEGRGEWQLFLPVVHCRSKSSVS